MTSYAAELQAQRLETHAEYVEVVLSRISNRTRELMGLEEDPGGRGAGVGRSGGGRFRGCAPPGSLEGKPAGSLDQDGAFGEAMLDGLE